MKVVLREWSRCLPSLLCIHKRINTIPSPTSRGEHCCAALRISFHGLVGCQFDAHSDCKQSGVSISISPYRTSSHSWTSQREMCFMAVVYQWFYPSADYAGHSVQTGQCMGCVRANVCFVEVLCQSIQVFSGYWEPNRIKYACLFIYFSWQVHHHIFKI